MKSKKKEKKTKRKKQTNKFRIVYNKNDRVLFKRRRLRCRLPYLSRKIKIKTHTPNKKKIQRGPLMNNLQL